MQMYASTTQDRDIFEGIETESQRIETERWIDMRVYEVLHFDTLGVRTLCTIISLSDRGHRGECGRGDR